MKNDRICLHTAGSQLRALAMEHARSEGPQPGMRKLMKCSMQLSSATCGYKTHSCGGILAENQALLEEKACQQFE